MQLIPGRTFTIVRQLNNPFITDTFYVRAVIRDAYTDAILATVNLTDKTGQRFKGDWVVSPDPLGLGRFVSIVTSVYTDSGYTTKSENYGDEENTYLIAELQKQGRGGGAGVDYQRVREIIRDETGGMKEDIIKSFPTIPEPKETKVDFSEVIDAIKNVESLVQKIPVERIKLTPVIDGIGKVLQAIEDKEVTPVTDITPILDKLNEDSDTGENNHSELKDALAEQTKEILGAVPSSFAKVLRKTKLSMGIASNFTVQGKTDPTEKETKKESVEQEEEIDPRSLVESLSRS